MNYHLNERHMRSAEVRLGFFCACLFLPISSLSAQQYKLRATFEGHTDAIESLSFSPDGKTLASGSNDKSIKLWDVATGQNTVTLKEKRPYLWSSVAFSPDGKSLASGGWFNKVKLWDVGTLKGTLLLDEHKQCPAQKVVFSPDGKTLASGSMCNATMRLFDVANGKHNATLVTQDEINAWGVEAMAFTPDGKTLVSVGRYDGINLWDVATGKRILPTLKAADKVRIEKLIGNLGNAEYVEREKAARELEAVGPLAIDTLKQATKHQDAEISNQADKLVKLLRARTITEQMGAVAAFSVDCKTLATGGSADNNVKLWEVTAGKEQRTLRGHTADVWSLVFSPDGKMLATGSEDGTIKLWEVATGKELAIFKAHSKTVSSLAFSPDAKTLASGSEDKTIKLWDVAKAR